MNIFYLRTSASARHERQHRAKAPLLASEINSAREIEHNGTKICLVF